MRMNAEDAAAVRAFAGTEHAMHADLLIANPDMDRRPRARPDLQNSKDHRADERALEAWRRGRYAGPKPVPVALTRRREAEAAKLAAAKDGSTREGAPRRRSARPCARTLQKRRASPTLPPFERLAAIHGRQSDGTVRVPAALIPQRAVPAARSRFRSCTRPSDPRP